MPNIGLIAINEKQYSNLVLNTVAMAMINDKNILAISPDLSNVSARARALNDASMHTIQVNTGLDSVEAILWAFTVVADGYKIQTGPGTQGQAFEILTAVLDFAQTELENYAESEREYLSKANGLILLQAYAEEYSKFLQLACDEYIAYLETTYTHDNKLCVDLAYQTVYDKAVAAYIEAFRRLKNDPDQLYSIAYEQILGGTGYTKDQLTAMWIETQEALKKVQNDSFLSNMLVDIVVQGITHILSQKAKLDDDMVKDFRDRVSGCIGWKDGNLIFDCQQLEK